MVEQYPRAWDYLKANADLLSARSSVSGGVKWYELIRPRSEGWLSAPKLIMRDLAQRPSFGVDQGGQIFLIGGTAVVPSEPELVLPLLAYLNSATVDRLVSRTTPQFRGNFRKYEPRHIEAIPVINSLLEDAELQGNLSSLAKDLVDIDGEEGRSELQRVEDEIDAMISGALRDVGIEIR